MFGKILRIVLNFYKIARRNEIAEILLVPSALVGLLGYLTVAYNICLQQFTSSFTDSVISIVSLLAAFGIASVTILLTSSSNNIENAKKWTIDRVDYNKKPITYFQLLLIRNFYTLIMQLLLLFSAIIIKILFLKFNSLNVFLFFEVFALTHILMTQVMCVTSIYHLLWKDKEQDKDSEN